MDLDRRSSLRAVVAVAALALLVRLVGLGTRVFHWDEGRVGYWILRYHETGEFAYRPIVHGPFLFIVNNWVFSVLPPTDFSARLVVAVVGGLLPLSAWLLSDHLDRVETAALAVVFAVNPLLVYYSRFMRNDVLVGAFAFLAFALGVRAMTRHDVRLVYPAAAALGLAFTAKENALIYVLCFLGAGALIVDHRLFRTARAGGSVRRLVVEEWRASLAGRLERWGGSVRRGLGLAAGHAIGAMLVFLAVVVFFYAPRPDLWQALGDPARLPGVIEAATVGTWESLYELWISGGHGNDYLPFLYDYVETLVYGAPFVLAFAVVGFLADGYDDDGSRAVVAAATYWGAVSILGYPIATDIRAPWVAVHAVVPLAVPAAVGVAAVGRRAAGAVAAWRDPDGADAPDGSVPRPTLRAGMAVLVLMAAAVGVVGANATYTDSASDAEAGEVIQWAQPENDLKRTLALVEGVSRVESGTDVLFVGTYPPGDESDVHFYVEDESSVRQAPPGGPSWHSRLPLPWYLERYGANVTSTPPDDRTVGSDPPPVVVAAAWDEETVASQLEGYERHRHDFRLWSEEIVIFVDREALATAREQGYL